MILAALLFLGALGVSGSEHRWTSYAYPAAFERISVEQGLSQSTVHGIVQDKQGFLWFATGGGLNRYDGYRFQVFRNDKNNPNSLGANRVSALLIDRKGYLWVGTVGGGLHRLDTETLEMQRFMPGDQPGSIASDSIETLAQDREGNLWIGTASTGLCMLPAEHMPPQTPRFVTFKGDPKDPAAPPQGYIQAMFVDRNGTLWLGSSAGLSRLLGYSKDGKAQFEYFRPEPARPDSLPPGNCISIGQDAEGNLWAGSWDGLYLCMPDRGLFRRFTASPGNPTGLINSIVRGFYLDRAGDFWIANDGGGLLKMLPRSGTETPPSFRRFQHDPKNPHSLSGNGIQCLAEDRSGVLWVSAYQAGLNKLVFNLTRKQDREKPTLFQYRNNAADPGSLSGNVVASIAQDRFGNLWIGTDGTGANRVIPPGNPGEPLRFERYRAGAARNSIPSDVVLCMHLDSRQQLWMGTYMGGLLKVESSSASGEVRFTQIKGQGENPETLSDNFIRVIRDDGTGRLWIGTNGGGLNLYDPQTQKVRRFYMGKNNAFGMRVSNTVTDLAMDAFGTVWIATPDGLNRLNPSTGEVRGYTAGGEGSLSDSDVLTLHIDKSGVLWVGTGGGLNKASIPPWDGSEPRFASYGLKDGLPSAVIESILEEENGQFWISTDRFLCRFDPKEGRGYPFTWQSELKRSEFIKNSMFRSAAGEMFFGSNDGFSLFHPSDIAPNQVEPSLAITGLQVLNKPVSLGDRLGAPDAAGERELVIYPKDSIFSLEFAGLHFVEPSRNKYSYLMEGLDQAWNDIGNQHLISYTQIPPGKYTLKVIGSNCDGLWGKEGLRLKIRVLPPWYKTWWARTIFFGTLGISILLGFRWYLSALSRRNAYLEETIEAKTRELRSANEALKALVARIQALSFTLASSATQMSSHTENMASATKQIAKGTLSQRQNAERMAAAMIEFSASIEEVTGHVRSSIRMVEEAVRSAGEGEGAGKSTYNAMNRIKETTKRITSIVEVMQEIAHQTNLLSLNAAIEAVKAGDAGRGFTVVAGEVGKLADRSSVAARQITQLIGESAEVVRDGVVTVDTTVSALEQIRVVIRKLADMTTQIGFAAEQQAKTSEEVAKQVETEASETVYNATAIQALTASVDELALSSAEIARAAEELSHIARELRI